MKKEHVHENYLPGLWLGSIYGPGGRRTDNVLELRTDGRFKKITILNGGVAKTITGMWRYTTDAKSHEKSGDESGVLYLDSGHDDVRRYSVLTVSTCEDSNCMLVLRKVILASRNLPTVYYRSHENPANCWRRVELTKL